MFKSFFKNKINDESKKSPTIDDNLLIIACVLVEAALVDNNFGNDEKSIIIKLLQKQYKIKNIGDIKTSSVKYLIPVFVIIWGNVFLSEEITFLILIGFIFIMLGLYLINTKTI